MLQIVGALILLIAGFAILRLLFRALISTASALAGLILLCLFGPALLAGYITERITRLFHIRWLAGVFLTIAGMIISFMWGLDGKHIALEAHTFDSYSAAIFLIPICISFDTAEKRRYATYLILNRRFSFEF
ncbi:hypothetical protein DPU25_000855 [Escherichia coli]|nr:hypothetical protein [Escherichia coli]